MRRSRDAYDRSVVSIVVFSGILNIFRGFRSFCGIRQRIHVDCRGIAVDATMLATLQWQAVERHFIRRVFTVAFRGIGNHLDFQTMRLTTPAHRILEFATSQRATPMQRAVDRSAAAVPPPCGMGRADNRRQAQADTMRRPAARQNVLLAATSLAATALIREHTKP